MARLPLYVDLSRDAPIWSRRGEPVAQPVEHLTFNQGVTGSNPRGLTNKIKHLPLPARANNSSKVALKVAGDFDVAVWRAKAQIGVLALERL